MLGDQCVFKTSDDLLEDKVDHFQENIIIYLLAYRAEKKAVSSARWIQEEHSVVTCHQDISVQFPGS